MRTLRTILAACWAVLAVTSVAAQVGGLRVTVYEARDRTPLPGVTVVLRNTLQLVATTTVVTNKSGTADFPVLRAGSGYYLEVSCPGFAKQQMANIRISINQVQSVSFLLAPELTEKVIVQGKGEVVDIEKTSTSTKFGEEFIQDLPVQGRFYQNVLTLAAGVQDADGDGNPNVNGARNVDFKAEVGGVSNQDPLTGLQMSQVNPDSIEEIEVITAGAGVEFGRAQGGFANIIQKQGSNDFEGTFNFLYKSSLLDGNAAAFPGARIPDYRYLEPAVQVSGPIVRNKLWYRFSHEYIDREDPTDTTNGTVVVTTKRQINSDAITWQASPRNKLQFTYSNDPLTITNWGVSRLTSAESSQRRELGGPLYRLGWTAPFSARVLVDSVISYQDSRTNILPTTSGVTNRCVAPEAGTGLEFLATTQCTNLETGERSGSFFLTWRDHRQRLTARSTASIFGGRFLGMDHQFKVGFTIENERYFRRQIRRPDVTFYIYRASNENTSDSSTLEPTAIVTGRFAVTPEATSRAVGTAGAVFLEDVVKPRQNLSLTLGFRVDRESVGGDGFQPFDPAQEEENFYLLRERIARQYAEETTRQDPGPDPEARYAALLANAYENGSLFLQALNSAFTAYERVGDFAVLLSEQVGHYDVDAFLGPVITFSKNWYVKRRTADIDISMVNLSPHLAVSWDPWSNGKTKLAFSARRLYGATPLNVVLSEVEPVIASLRFEARRPKGSNRWNPRLARNLNPSAQVQVVDRNLRTPYNDEITLTFERELWAETSAKLTYIYRRFRDQFQDRDINHSPQDYGRCVIQTDPRTVGSWIEIAYDERGRPIGDGLMDDCDGKLVPVQEATGGADPGGNDPRYSNYLHRPDKFLDNYVHNPGWGAIYLTGNYNSALYKGIQLEVVRRQYRNWQMNASYAWSRAVGDGESWNSFLGDDRTTREAETGYLSYDVRHTVKFNATTITPWGFRAGTAISWQTGLPYSILIQKPSPDTITPPLSNLGNPEPRQRLLYTTGRRNDKRNRPYWNFDVRLDKEMNVGKGTNLQLAVDVFNLLDDRTYLVYNQFLELGDQVNGYNDAYSRIGRTYQLSARLSF